MSFTLLWGQRHNDVSIPQDLARPHIQLTNAKLKRKELLWACLGLPQDTFYHSQFPSYSEVNVTEVQWGVAVGQAGGRFWCHL